MKYETVKSIVLTLLVIISIFLTWNLWSYQPNYEKIESGQPLEDVRIGTKKSLEDLIQPSKIVFHKSSAHFATLDETEMNKITKEIKKWEIYDFKNISTTIPNQKYLSFIHENGHVEIIFPDKIPLELLKLLLKINEKELPSVSFDRIIIDVKNTDSAGGNLYFVAYDEQIVYQARVSNEFVDSFERNYYYLSTQYPRYFAFSLSETRAVYLPEGRMPMEKIQYYTDNIDPEDFKDALFTDPNFVKKDVSAYGEVYTDGTRLLEVNKSRNLIRYINPVSSDYEKDESYAAIQNSVDFVNDHSGWTDKYYFFSWNKLTQKTTFRLRVNNYPVFHLNGLAELNQVWGRNEITRYSRPLLMLELPLDRLTYNLPSGYEVVNLLKTIPDLQYNKIEDIMIGYELIEDQTKFKVITLQPMWTFQYDGSWIKLNFEESGNVGGNVVGLE
ncbi:two-component system activity regulator YycH [Bacillus timonensis]|nr:two-component system activity regulator YycH [Bacillus timonensis]